MKRRKRKQHVRPTPPDYKTPVSKLFEKPYSEWTRSERKWLDKIYKRLFPSRRGRIPLPIYADLYREREMAKLSGPMPTYREQASKIADKADPNYIDKNTGISEGEYRRQRVIRAYQRRRKAQHLPDPPKN